MKNLTKGSQVKVTKKQKYHEFSVGDIVTIWSQSANNAWYATGEEGASGWLFEEDMEEVEEEVKYVPEVGDIVKIVGNNQHHAIMGTFGEVASVYGNHASVLCVAKDGGNPVVCAQAISLEDIEKVGEVVKKETNDSKDFKKGDKVWVKGIIDGGLDDDGDYAVRVEDYGSSAAIYARPSQLKRR